MIKGGMNKCITKLTLNLNFPGELLQNNNKIMCTENFYFPLNFTKGCRQSGNDSLTKKKVMVMRQRKVWATMTYNARNYVISRCFAYCIARKCTKNYKVRAKPLLCSLNLLFADVAVVVVVCSGSLNFDLFSRTVSFSRNCKIMPSRT